MVNPSSPDHDDLALAVLFAVALRNVPEGWREPGSEETGSAVAELRAVGGVRPDLLAQVAGLLIGAGEGSSHEVRDRIAAGFCIAAGAAESLIDDWVTEGAGRARVAGLPVEQHPWRPER